MSLTQNNKVRSNLLPLSVLEATVRAGAHLVRVVGKWSCRTSAADVNLELTYAMYMQRLEAFTAGVDPELSLDEYPYLDYNSHAMRINVSAADSDTNQWHAETVDTKSRRKFRSPEDTLVILFENTSDDAGTIDRMFRARILVWIP